MIRGGYWEKGEIWPFFLISIKMKKNWTCSNTLKNTIFCWVIRFVLFRNLVIFCVFYSWKKKSTRSTLVTIFEPFLCFFYDFLPAFTCYHFRGPTWPHLVPREICNFCSPGSTRDMQFSRLDERCTIFALLVPREICNFCSPGSTRDYNFRGPTRDIQFSLSLFHERYTIPALLVPREIYNFCLPGSARDIQFLLPWVHERYTILALLVPQERTI